MTTARQTFEIAMSLIDERLESGVVDPNTTLIYQKNAPYILTSLQDELLDNAVNKKSYSITRFSLQPIIGSFEVEQHDSEDIIKEGNNVAKSYYFEVNGTGTVYIEDYTTDWNIVATISTTGDNAYSAVITPTSGATKTRIRFSGTGYYLFKNWALFKEGTTTVFKKDVPYAMPSDFQDETQIIEEEYGYADKFRWENCTLYIPYNFTGTYRVLYKPIPASINALDDVLTLEDTVCRTTLANGLASRLIATENAKLSNYFGNIYLELKFKRKPKKPAQAVEIKDYYDSKLTY